MADIFQTSISGMLAFQRALATTSHNISNVNTPGYSRQRTEFSTLTPNLMGGSWVGSGVGVSAIERMVDQSRLQSVRSNTAEYSRLSTFADLNGRIDSLAANADAGLAPVLQSFFDSVQQAASDPTSRTARQVVLTEAENLAGRFAYFDTRLRELDTEVDNRIALSVDEINQYADNIARLNQQIVQAMGQSQGASPNDLLDQRDELIRQLSERVGTNVVSQENGAVNVFIGNGQTLVAGQTASELTLVPDPADPTRNQVGFISSGVTVNITNNLTGGSLGGLLDFRRESLDSVRAELDTLAENVVATFNAQHSLGASTDGSAVTRGGDFFSIGDPANPLGSITVAVTDPDRIAWANPATVGERLVNGQAANLGSGKIAAPVVDLNVDLAAFAPITLTYTDIPSSGFDGSDGSFHPYDPTDPAAVEGSPFTLAVGGGTITVTLSGVPRVGDAFVVRPNAEGAGDGANLRNLAALSDAGTMTGGATFQEYYGSVVGRVGTQTLRANVNRDAQSVLLEQATAAREQISGVNLDEEAADMLRYQQAYQASAQLITVANSLFQSLLSAVGR